MSSQQQLDPSGDDPNVSLQQEQGDLEEGDNGATLIDVLEVDIKNNLFLWHLITMLMSFFTRNMV